MARWSTFPAALVNATAAIAAEPAGNLAERVAALVQQLGNDDFVVRDEARAQLIALAGDAATQSESRRLLATRLADKSLSFDVREVLRTIVPPDVRNTPVAEEGAKSATAAEIKSWLDDVEAASFERREEIRRSLSAAAADPRTCGLILEQILARDANETATVDALKRLQTLWDAAWKTWIRLETPAWLPQEPSDKRLATLIDRVVREAREPPPAPSHVIINAPGANPFGGDAPQRSEESTQSVHNPAGAARELLLLLACEKYATRTADAIHRRAIDPNTPAAAAGRLDELYSVSRPAMAAEIWSNGDLGSTGDERGGKVQYLIIGVPNQPLMAQNPSLFDRCDDKTAHCASGNLLTPGDYPVGVYFQPPRKNDPNIPLPQPGLMFHLVNLPTARRRLAYDVEVPIRGESFEELRQLDERRRVKITRRTVDYLLARKQILSEREIDMFPFFDPAEASRFAEPYLMTVADERYDSGSPQPFGNGSLHGWFCYVMTQLETPEAGRAIAKAIDAKRVLPPTDAKPYRIDWAAALMLAELAPWPQVDEWLAGQLDRTEPMRIDQPEAADVGAGAAAVLLKHHDVDPAEYSLSRHEFPELIDLESPGYRFAKPEGRDAVKKWWGDKKRQQSDIRSNGP